MLKDADQELIKRRQLTSLPMTDFARQVAPPIQLPLPLPLPLNLPLPLPLPLLAKTPGSDHAPMHSTPPTTPPTPPPLPLNMSQTKTSETSGGRQSPPATPPSAGPAMAHASSGPQDHYSLRWNNHQNHILRAFDALLQTKTLVDVTLVCAETSIRAHKMVLSACSPFFQRVFAETPCKHPVIVLKDFRGWVVQAIVDFMYRGEISVPQQRLQTLIQAGESLQVRGLVESSVPEHTPTPAASPDDFGMLDTSMLSSSFEDDGPPSMVRPSAASAGKQVMMPSAARMFGNHHSTLLSLRRKREQEQELESDQELGGSSPMPRRKQARPRRRSGDVPHDFALGPSKSETESLQTVIKHELLERTESNQEEGDQDTEARRNDSATTDSSEEQVKDKSAEQHRNMSDCRRLDLDDDEEEEAMQDRDDAEEEQEEEQDIEELIHTTNELRRQAAAAAANAAAAISPTPSPCPSDGPEDLCTTKKDKKDRSNHSTAAPLSDCESNNNNSSKLQDNNQRIMLSLKDIRQLNANPNAGQNTPSSGPGSGCNNNGLLNFPPPGMRPPGLPDSPPCHMEALEAQMHAAAAAAAAAAAGDHPFHHMEHQMEMSLAAAAAAAAMHQREPRDPRDPRDHNAFASNLLGPMGMSPFGGPNGGGPSGQSSGPGNGGCPGQAPHERLEESMNRLSKELGKEFGKDFAPTSPMSLPGHFNPPDGPPHPPSPLPFPGMSSAMTLTPPHMFGLDSPLGLFPPGIDPGKLYNPLMEMSDPREMPGGPPPFLKKKMPRPKGQHSAPRGGPPRSWTNTELTEALQHVWNKKMTTSQASRIFGIPYNSLLMYVRGKYGKSLKLEQLRKDCISGPPIEMLQMGISGGGGSGSGGSSSSKSEKSKERKEKDKDKNSSGSHNSGGSGNSSSGGPSSGNGPHHGEMGPLGSLDLELGLPLGPPGGPRSGSSEPDLLGGPNALFNPFNPQGFYPDFAGGFPGLPLSMLNLLPPSERHHAAAAMHHLGVTMDEDCKSVGSKQSSSLDDDFPGSGLPLSLEQRRELGANGPPPVAQSNGSAGQD
ncbi:hypothetical protein KR074_004980 [Drosophila pseudoananassae]|nr:hypothetical protein KR074_004980 [Drosophila pseudoananassae]